MSALDEVMAEEWIACGDHIVAGAGTADSPRFAVLRAINGDAESPDVRVAVLGKRALALVIEHEWSSVELEGGAVEFCAACGSAKGLGHRDGCDVGALCDEVRKMRGGT